MKREIFLLRDDKNLEELHEEPYETESLLQHLLEKYPSLLSGPQIDPRNPRRWLLVRREARLPSDDTGGGRLFLDHLLLDQDAIPTLVEVKRSSDTRIRREVVGQMLDYAANAVAYLPIESLIAQFEEQCRICETDPTGVLAEFLEVDLSPEEFWNRVKTNLQAGRVRLVFVADEIPPELRSIVEFLNQQMDPASVLAIEIKQFVGAGLRTLVPSVIGQTVEAQQRKSPSRGISRQWDEVSYFEELSMRSPPEEVAVARRLLDWAIGEGLRIWWGQGAKDGSFVPVLDHAGRVYSLFAAYTYGAVEVYFQWLKSRPPFDSEEKRVEFLNRLNSAPSVSFPQDAISRRPSVRFSALMEPETLTAFTESLEWFLSEVRAYKIPTGE